jgi:hypothetical protein
MIVFYIFKILSYKKDKTINTHFILIVIPLLWSIIGFMAALNFGIYEDIGLLIAGVCGSFLVLIRNRSPKEVHCN